jgi:hypothetical protein
MLTRLIVIVLAAALFCTFSNAAFADPNIIFTSHAAIIADVISRPSTIVTATIGIGVLPEALIPDAVVARDWFHICLRTLARWDKNPELGFPQPVRINKRKFRRAGELLEFMRVNALARASGRTGAPDSKTKIAAA